MWSASVILGDLYYIRIGYVVRFGYTRNCIWMILVIMKLRFDIGDGKGDFV
jgi:hypothetical protein